MNPEEKYIFTEKTDWETRRNYVKGNRNIDQVEKEYIQPCIWLMCLTIMEGLGVHKWPDVTMWLNCRDSRCELIYLEQNN